MAHQIMKKRTQPPKTKNEPSQPAELPTFLEHLYELRRRLFWVVATVICASAAAYPFLTNILGFLTAPLGGQRLYYLTPIGGLNFSIKICIYVGATVAVPVMIYQLYRYLQPLMNERLRRSAVFYIGLSSLLAAGGMLFAYFVSLPAALHFLTGMQLKNIQALLTADSYLTFVSTYLLGAALLFQIPIILSIINTIKPLKPRKLLGYQRYLIVGAFIVAAIVSPTPDIINQTLLATPIILMYNLGVLLVWAQNKRRLRLGSAGQASEALPLRTPAPAPAPPLRPLAALPGAPPPPPLGRMRAPLPRSQVLPRSPARMARPMRTTDGFVRRSSEMRASS